MSRYILFSAIWLLFSANISANSELPPCDLTPPCGAQVLYSTPNGAYLFWCGTPDAVKYRLILHDSTGTTLDTLYTSGIETAFAFTDLLPGKYSTEIASGCAAQNGDAITYGTLSVTVAFKVYVIIDGVVMSMSPNNGTQIGQMNTTTPERTFNMGGIMSDTMKFRVEVWEEDTKNAAFILGFLNGDDAWSDAIYCTNILAATTYSGQNAVVWADGVQIKIIQMDRRGLFRLQSSNLSGKIVKVFHP